MTKTCKKCRQKKDVSDFYKNKSKANGRASYCKLCMQVYRKQYSKTEAARETHSRSNKKYRQTEKGQITHRESQLRYSENNTHKIIAHNKTNKALLCGKLTRGPCEVCGSTETIQGHHRDYDKPLEVNWLCQQHHDSLHHATI